MKRLILQFAICGSVCVLGILPPHFESMTSRAYAARAIFQDTATDRSSQVPNNLLQVAVGDEFVYQGRFKAESAGTRTWKNGLQVKLLVTVVSSTPEEGCELAYATSYAADRAGESTGLWPNHQFDFIKVTSFGRREAGAQPLHLLGQFVLPPFANSATVLKKEERIQVRHVRVGSDATQIPVRYALDTVDLWQGRKCSKIRVDHVGTLPASYKALGWYEGADPPELTLERFAGELLIEQEKGWLIKASYELDATVVNKHEPMVDRQGKRLQPKPEVNHVHNEFELTIQEISHLGDDQLAARTRQVQALTTSRDNSNHLRARRPHKYDGRRTCSMPSNANSRPRPTTPLSTSIARSAKIY